MRERTRRLTLLFTFAFGMGGCCLKAEAGPPLVCHALSVEEGAELLPWEPTQGFRGRAPGLDAGQVVDRTLELLDDELPLFARVETMRRAALSLEADKAAGQRLLDALIARTVGSPDSMLAWFDAGTLAATYRQGSWYFRQKGGRPSLKDTDVDGWLRRAQELAPGDARIALVHALADVGDGEGEPERRFAAVLSAVKHGDADPTLRANVDELRKGHLRDFLVGSAP